MKVLVACEYSGVVRDAFISRGHDATSCDLLPTDTPGPHIQGDVREHLNDGWDLMVAHPPCTYLANSGARWIWDGQKVNEERFSALLDAVEFFKTLLDAPIPKIAVENPIMLGAGKILIGQRETQVIQPYHHGHPVTKATCLWLQSLPNLKETNMVKPTRSFGHDLPPSDNRWKIRSTTFKGIAEAMADQWGTA